MHHAPTRKDASNFHRMRHPRPFASIHELIGASLGLAALSFVAETRLQVEFRVHGFDLI